MLELHGGWMPIQTRVLRGGCAHNPLVLLIKQICAPGVCDGDEHAEHSCRDTAAIKMSRDVSRRSELNDECDEVEYSLDPGTDQLRCYPVNRQFESLPNAEKVYKAPHKRGDEGCHCHETEPTRAAPVITRHKRHT